jgi:hypothetical protein
MLFIILFVGFSIAVPVLIESYKNGRDNILVRSGTEVLESKILHHAVSGATSVTSGVTALVVGVVSVIGIGFGLYVILRLIVLAFGVLQHIAH